MASGSLCLTSFIEVESMFGRDWAMAPIGSDDHYKQEGGASKPAERASELPGVGPKPAGRDSRPARKGLELGGWGLEQAGRASKPLSL